MLELFFGLNCMVVNNIQLQNHSVSKQCSGTVAPSPNKGKLGLARVRTYMVDIIVSALNNSHSGSFPQLVLKHVLKSRKS